MTARSEQRASEAEWRESQRGVLHDEHDAATDDDKLPPLWPVLLGFAATLVAVCLAIGWALPVIADKVFS
jgi:hypothetical protein